MIQVVTVRQAFEAALRVAQVTSERDACAVHVYAVLRLVDGAPTITGFRQSEWRDEAVIATFDSGVRQ